MLSFLLLVFYDRGSRRKCPGDICKGELIHLGGEETGRTEAGSREETRCVRSAFMLGNGTQAVRVPGEAVLFFSLPLFGNVIHPLFLPKNVKMKNAKCPCFRREVGHDDFVCVSSHL